MRRYTYEKRRNVTLIEVVICMSIIIIISTLCFFNGDNKNYILNSFTKQLCSDIRYVRKCNMMGDLKTYIYYKEEKNYISYILRSNSKDIKEVQLPKGASLAGLSKISFKQDGTPISKGSTIKVYNGIIKKEITIVPVSGRVLLKEGRYEA